MRLRQKKIGGEKEKASVQIASTKLIRVFSSRSTIFVYFNRNNDFFLCSTSFLLSCAPPILNKSAHKHTHSYIQRLFFSPFFLFFPTRFFFISPITSFLPSLSLSFAISHRRKQITEKTRERQRNQETTSLPTHHITLHIHKNLILRSLPFSNTAIT